MCIFSNFIHGQGQLYFFSLNAKLLTKILKNKLSNCSPDVVFRKLDRRISRSEGTLFTMTDFQNSSSESERDSGNYFSKKKCSSFYSFHDNKFVFIGISSLSSKSKSQWYYPLTDPSVRLSVNDDGLVLKGKVNKYNDAVSFKNLSTTLSKDKFSFKFSVCVNVSDCRNFAV